MIEQGNASNLAAGPEGEIEYAISSQSRAGNLELFANGRFTVWIYAVSASGTRSEPGSILVELEASYRERHYSARRKFTIY